MTQVSESELYRQALDNLDRAVIVIDNGGKIRIFNPSAQIFTGFSERQASGRPFRDLFARQPELIQLIEEANRQGRSIAGHEELELQRNFAPPLPISASVCPLYHEKSGTIDGVVLILRDLSRLKELEDAVRQSDRLSMLGTLAAGLAHEIKNPLGGIKGAAQLLAMEIASREELKEYTDIMIRESERINAIIEELLNLAKPHQRAWQEVSLTRILNDIVLFQQEAFRTKAVRFELQLDPSIPPIRGDEDLLTRLFLNLVKNAGEAVSQGGEIIIRSRIGSEVHLNQAGNRPVPFVVVEVADNGPGIPPEQQEKLFTPFFTSKAMGTGLGLATCQKIVTEHDGFIRLQSRPGSGTNFRVALPFIRSRNGESGSMDQRTQER